MVKSMYSRMIRKLQLSGGSQDLQQIPDLLMDLDFGVMKNLMPLMTGNLSLILNIYKEDHETPTLT